MRQCIYRAGDIQSNELRILKYRSLEQYYKNQLIQVRRWGAAWSHDHYRVDAEEIKNIIRDIREKLKEFECADIQKAAEAHQLTPDQLAQLLLDTKPTPTRRTNKF